MLIYTETSGLRSSYLDTWQDKQSRTHASFQQSGAWACFQERLGQKVFCMSGEGWSALCVERRTPLGTYWFIPAGPTISSQSQFEPMLNTLATEARARGVLWLRFEPRGVEDISTHGRKLIRSPCEINPVRTQIISLNDDVSSLWQGIAPKHRSDIKHFESIGGTCRASTDSADVEKFIEFYVRLGKSKARLFRDEAYIRAQFDLPFELRPRLYCAYNSEGTIVSGCVIYDFAGMSSYVYAASSEDIREYRGANHALVWQAIKQAAERGSSAFDLFGVCDLEDTQHSWYGLTKFKSKFGGAVVTYSQPYDFPLAGRYYLLRIMRSSCVAVRQVSRGIRRSLKRVL